jgi:hypothetical protein
VSGLGGGGFGPRLYRCQRVSAAAFRKGLPSRDRAIKIAFGRFGFPVQIVWAGHGCLERVRSAVLRGKGEESMDKKINDTSGATEATALRQALRAVTKHPLWAGLFYVPSALEDPAPTRP